MLFKAYPGSDQVKVIWMIPDRLMWDSYKVGNITESETVLYSIDMFENHRAILDAKEEGDLTDEKANEVYRELSVEARRKKYMEKLHKQGVVLPKQDSLVVF
jgi:hypothetical protein